jgi:hypothetical protein
LHYAGSIVIKLKRKEWSLIKDQLKEDYNPSVLMIREVMRRELGCTLRVHRQWDELNYRYNELYCLDFYDDIKETWFRMKYL